MDIVAVLPHYVESMWDEIRPLIESANEYADGEMTLEYVYEQLTNGNYILLVVLDEGDLLAVQTFEIYKAGNKTVLSLVTTAGEHLMVWQEEMITVLDRIAKEMGCDVIQTRGRPGWLKKLKLDGFDPLYFVAQKRVG